MLGCEIAYKRVPTQAEGDAFGAWAEECFVPMGGWTGRRCRACGRWVWGGPTACEGCVRREERDMARDCQQDDVCAAPPGCQRHWEERCRELVAERDQAREQLATATARAESAEALSATVEWVNLSGVPECLLCRRIKVTVPGGAVSPDAHHPHCPVRAHRERFPPAAPPPPAPR